MLVNIMARSLSCGYDREQVANMRLVTDQWNRDLGYLPRRYYAGRADVDCL